MASDSADSAYVACADEISQGDIVANLPWGVIDAPLVVCRPDDDDLSRGGRAPYGEASTISRAFNRKGRGGKEFVLAKAGRGPGVVMWHTCEIADDDRRGRGQRAVVGVAPIFGMKRLNKADQQPVRDLNRTAFFPLQPLDVGDAHHLDESYVDFRWIWSIRRSLLVKRLACLSPPYLELMYERLEHFFVRRRPR